MSGILKIKRDTTSPITLNDGEFYLNKGIGTIQIGSGSTILTLLPLNQTVSGNIFLNGNIFANNLNISSSYALTSSYAHFAETTGNVVSSSYSETASFAQTSSYILSQRVFGPNGFNSILTASYALTASHAPDYLLISGTGSMLGNYLLLSNTGSMLSSYVLNSQTSSFVTNTQTSSFVTNSQTSSFILVSQTGSMLSSYVLNSQTSSFVTNTQTSSFVTNTQTGSFILNTQTASMTVGTASFVTGSIFTSTNPVLTASYAHTASLALGVVGFGNLASSSYPFNVTGSTIYSYNSNISQSSKLNVTTDHSFIVGERAGIDRSYIDPSSNSINSHSIIIGYEAGYASLATSHNILLGNQSGYTTFFTSHSFFAGDSAGRSTISPNSIFIGRNAGREAYFANNSIFLGLNTGRLSQSSSYSTYIGYNVGSSITIDGPGQNNIIIGTNISLQDNIANSISFGNIIYASGAYSTVTGNPSRFPVSNGRVGINVYPTNYNFEVNGTANISNGLYVTSSINLTGSINQIGNTNITGSLLVSGNINTIGAHFITGSLTTSGSNTFYGTQSVSGNVSILNNLDVYGTASFYYFVTQFVTTSTIIATGSNQLGDSLDDVQNLIGTVNISGSLVVTGSVFLTASNVSGGESNYIPIWKTENSLGTSSLYQTSSNILIGTTTNPSNDFKLYVSGNIGLPSYQISSISASNNLNYVGIFRPSGSSGNTNFLETAQTESQHKWVFRGATGFGDKRFWNQNQASIFNINLGWESPSITTFTGSTLLIDPHINVTNGNAAMLRGIYYNPTISASVNTNHIAIETTTGSVLFKNLESSSTIRHVILYDTGSGQLYYTASSEIGGSGVGFPFSGSAVITGSLLVSGSGVVVTGSLNVTNGITGAFSGSVFGHVTNAQTGSFAITGSNIFVGNQTITGRLIVSGSSPTIRVTGSINVSGSITGSLLGTASFASTANAVTVTNSNAGGSTRYLAFVLSGAGVRNIEINTTRLQYDNITGTINATASRATIAETVQGGTQNYVALWNTATSLSRSIIYQTAASKLGIGTITPDYLTHISNTTGQQVLKVEGTGSTNPIFLVEGSQGELFSVTDNISGSLFSVNDNSGLPIIDVISDGTVLMGSYASPSLNTTVKVYTLTTYQSIYQIPTGSYDAAFVEYYYTSGSYYGSGYLVSSWSGSSISNNDDVRATNGGSVPTFEFALTGSNAELVVTATAGYLIKAIIRSI